MDTEIYLVHPTDGMSTRPYGWEGQDYKMVMASDFDRVTAERDALQLRLNAVEEENDRLMSALKQITEIEDELYGEDWEEIEKARGIATLALEKRP